MDNRLSGSLTPFAERNVRHDRRSIPCWFSDKSTMSICFLRAEDKKSGLVCQGEFITAGILTFFLDMQAPFSYKLPER